MKTRKETKAIVEWIAASRALYNEQVCHRWVGTGLRAMVVDLRIHGGRRCSKQGGAREGTTVRSWIVWHGVEVVDKAPPHQVHRGQESTEGSL